jgi:hypothetical protein
MVNKYIKYKKYQISIYIASMLDIQTSCAPRFDKLKQPNTTPNYSASNCHLSELGHLPASHKKCANRRTAIIRLYVLTKNPIMQRRHTVS